MSMSPSKSVVLPVGWTIPTWRETSQQDPTGRVVSGIQFSLSSPLGQVTQVFVPSHLLSSTDAVEAAFNERIAAITAITG